MSEKTDQKKPVEVSREDLYRKVWQMPMNRLAGEYGISGNGLAKICDRLNVPYPPRGWWAKKAAGKKVVIYRLPSPEPSTLQNVRISPTAPKSRVQEVPAEVQAIVKFALVKVPDRLQRPHRIIEATLLEREERRREAKRERDPHMRKFMDPGEFTDADRRRHRILDTLFKALQKHGGKLDTSEKGGFSAEMQGEAIEFVLREKQKRARRPLTPDEQRWATPGGKSWRPELQPAGILYITIRTYMAGKLRTEWIENSRNTLESLLPEILGTIVAAGPVLAEQRKAREEAEH